MRHFQRNQRGGGIKDGGEAGKGKNGGDGAARYGGTVFFHAVVCVGYSFLQHGAAVTDEGVHGTVYGQAGRIGETDLAFRNPVV